jgi:hypothetical protein
MLNNIEELLKNIRHRQLENRLKLGDKWKEEDNLKNMILTYEDGGAFWDRKYTVKKLKWCQSGVKSKRRGQSRSFRKSSFSL